MTTGNKAILRFSISDRAEHWVQMVTFVVLAATGLPQRYEEVWISEQFIDALGGIETVRDIHRVFATVLMVAVIYHFGGAAYRRYVLSRPRTMLPRADDARAVWGSLRYVAGRRDEPPPQGRFTWEEKVEYWSFVWGTVLMVITGFLLWNPIATTHILPGQMVPAAQVAHSAEATLAVLAIAVWHVYHVHLRHFNRSMFSGTLSRKEMKEFHPLELASIEAGEYPLPAPEVQQVRLRRFIAVYGFASVVLLAGVYLFVTFEKTAIDTIEPPEQVAVFAPVETLPPGAATTLPTTTTTTTTLAADGDTWDTISVLFDPTCTSCHGSSVRTSGLDLSSYDNALAGGEEGAGIVPGDADASVIVQIMDAGGHPGQLTDQELSRLIAWIETGAPETADGTPAGGSDAADGWTGVAALFDPTCTSCHGAAVQTAGLDLSSYEAAVAGGNRGAGIVPGDAAASVIVQIMEAGGHPGQLAEADLALLMAWIDAGAPEG